MVVEGEEGIDEEMIGYPGGLRARLIKCEEILVGLFALINFASWIK